MNRNTYLLVGVLTFVILGSVVYFRISDSRSSEAHSSTSAAQLPEQRDLLETTNNSDTTGVDAPDQELEPETSIIDKDAVGLTSLNDINEPSSITQAQRAFSGEASIVEALQNTASEQGWGYDELTKNLTFWSPLCSAPESKLGQFDISAGDDNPTTSDRIKEFCANFPSDFSNELGDLAALSLQETTAGTNDWSKRLNSIGDLGPAAALELAIIDLSDALYSGNYAQIADIVWFLGTSGLLERELKVDDSVSTMFSDIEVMIAVNASVYCTRLGGCGGSHPVTLGLCFQFSERQCDDPGNIHHAVEQILTGRELVGFYQMHQGILSLVSQHRRGDF